MQRIVARLAPAGILCAALAACTDVGDSLAPGTGTGDDATSGQTGGATYDAPPDSNDARDDTGTDGTVGMVSDASVASDAAGDTGMMSGFDTGSGNDSGSTQGADTGVAGSSDTGAPDTGVPDTGTPDTGQPDTGIVVDAGVPETGVDAGLDAGAGDAAADTGAHDSGTADGDATLGDGAADASVSDTGSTPDTGSAGEGGSTDPCDPNNPNATTITCLNSVSADCLSCAQANGCVDISTGGGSCEQGALATTNATLLAGPLPGADGGPTATTCAQVVAPATVPVTERAICFEVMRTIIASLCGASTQLTPCLCGATDPAVCLAGTATPTGPAYDLYACDFHATSGSTINAIKTNFPVPTFGAGAANNALSCAGAFGCHCFGD